MTTKKEEGKTEEDIIEGNNRISKILGITQSEILKFVMRYPDGISEPEIRNHLEAVLEITAMRNIKTHLEKMGRRNLISKTMSKGKPNLWKIDYQNPMSISYIVRDMLENNFRYGVEVFTSPGMKEILKLTQRDYYLNLVIGIIGANWTRYDPDIIKFHEEHQLKNQNCDGVLKAFNMVTQISPSFFISGYGRDTDVSILYHWSFNMRIYDSVPFENRLRYLSWHWILTALLVDINKRILSHDDVNDIIDILTVDERKYHKWSINKINTIEKDKGILKTHVEKYIIIPTVDEGGIQKW